ncbi:hypothetical protein BS50DRAFT_627157 [Corynespora cassiicola Philippines]|uniref:Uncharacterized protein n=1 Tax=Corynespora cassiicola Philippines TaxID=1448308 RepID=A0A2T2MZF3_CORCC|nr:hypothetical protein BS50DRAFT_627157 [Corynespora cassiicola Philippines]
MILQKEFGSGLDDDDHHWIHQEYVPSLLEWGEIRVFVVTSGKTTGARVPRIVHAIVTKWNVARTGSRIHAGEIDETSSFEAGLSYQKLQEFVLETYSDILAMGREEFDSLKVGARFDIGISPEAEQFFVNEITRWYNADYFSSKTLGKPYEKICKLYAQAFYEVEVP